MFTWTKTGRNFEFSVNDIDEFFTIAQLPRFQKISIQLASPSGYIVKARLSKKNTRILESHLMTLQDQKQDKK